MRPPGRTLPKTTDNSDMYNRAFPVGNALFFFAGGMMSLFRLLRQARVCAAQRSNESPSGAFERPNGLALARWRGLCPDKLGGICDKGYHGLRSASRWFCKFYCSKAVIVGLIFNTRQETISVSHIVMFAEKTYNAFEPVGHTKRRKERES